MPGKPNKKGRGVAGAFIRPAPAARDATNIVPHAGDGDHEFRGDGAMLSTMDEHGVEDIVGHMAEPEPDRAHDAMTAWNPSDPWSADNPAVSKTLRDDAAAAAARKRKFGK